MIQEILIAILSVTLVLSLYYNYKFARVILRVEDAIEDSLDDLNQRYQVMSEILQRPVFFDSVEVRKVIAEIGDSRDSILRAASRISSVDGRKE